MVKRYLIMLLFSLLSFGCTKRELSTSMQEVKISVSFSWNKLPSWDTPSDSMKLYFYGEDGSIFIKDATSAGFTGTILPQKYHIIALNTDAIGLIHENLDNYLTARAVSISQQPSFSNTVLNLSQPERVYVAALDNISIINGQSQHLVLTPEEYSKKATFKFVFSGEVNSIQSCRAEISGLSRGIKLHNGELLTNDEDLGSLIVKEINLSDYELSTFIFGVEPKNENSKLTLNFTFTDGFTKDLVFDVSNFFKNGAIAVNVIIYVEVFKETEGGFNVRIKSWIVTDENIVLKSEI